jgi:hypothetical protein
MDLRHLDRVHEPVPARSRPDVDHQAVEDVGVRVGEDVLDGADPLTVGREHRRPVDERQV